MASSGAAGATSALLREPHASNTAENAVRSLALVRTLEGASEVVVVCSIRHFPRVRFFFRRLYRRTGSPPLSLRRAAAAVAAAVSGTSSRRSRAWRATGAARCACCEGDRADARREVACATRGYPGRRWQGVETRSRWACCSIRAVARRRSRATSRTRSTRQGWPVTLASGSLGGRARSATRGRSSRASTPCRRLRRRGRALRARARTRWTRRSRCSPRTRSARGARPLVPARLARAGSAARRGLVEADRRLGRARRRRVLHLHHLTPIHEAAAPSCRTCRS